jgi:4,5-dihydroxyphthalate decarboxylase
MATSTPPTTTTLRTAIDTYGHTAPLKDGAVVPRGIEFSFVEIQPIIAAFRRMVRQLEFDLCEMAITTYMTAITYGKPLVALPVFPHRLFNHGALSFNVKSGIRSPKDLEGRRVGVRAYTVTQGVWTRGLLLDEYDVDPDRVRWVLVDEEHVAEFKHPPNVEKRVGAKMGDLLLGGEIDAAIGVGVVDSSDVQPLIPNAEQAEAEWGGRMGFAPINHLLVVQAPRLAAEPWIAQSLYEAFVMAKTESLARIARDGPSSASDRHVQRLSTATGQADPLPYGVEANRPALEMIIDYAFTQHIVARRFSPDELFVPIA